MTVLENFIVKFNKNKNLYRASKSPNLYNSDTFFALNESGAKQYLKNGANMYYYKANKPLKLFRLNKGSLEALINSFEGDKRQKAIINARNFVYPTVTDTRNKNKPAVMGRFSEMTSKVRKAERTIMNAIINKLPNIDGHIMMKTAPVASMLNKSKATNEYVTTKSMAASAVFRPEVAIFNAKAKVSIPKVNIKPAAFNANTPSPTRKTASNASHTPPPPPTRGPRGPKGKKGIRPLFLNSP